MKLSDFIRTCLEDETGAATIDWVVLTAALAGLGVAVIAVMEPAITELAEQIASDLGGTNVGGAGQE